MKTRRKCPKCGDVLGYDPGLGIVCSNEDCPVIDESDLWDPEHTGDCSIYALNCDICDCGEFRRIMPATITKEEFKTRFLKHIKDKGVSDECYGQYEVVVDDAWGIYTDHRDYLKGCVPEEWADGEWGIEVKVDQILAQTARD